MKGDGALNELVVGGIGRDNRELGRRCREEQVSPVGEKVQEFAELVFALEPEPPEDGHVLVDDWRGQAQGKLAGLPEIDDFPGIPAEERGNEDVGVNHGIFIIHYLTLTTNVMYSEAWKPTGDENER